MEISKLQFIIFCLWVYSLGHADEKISNWRLMIPDFEYRHAYQEDINSDTVTIVDKDGEITICQVMENGVIVCL
ncbi:hypothetical protein VI34_00385 [Methylophilales bacterium MBRSG12]|jgi:hypothetical protein|uniref:Uncharacterized protein n=1 Tax=Methylophilales bacterium MBRS-H7 TaxID=1623450 RepID=A0A0H4J0D3_9PROT|nr:hypothetical protein UZ34_02735 [Methylophilales bacterium MBRSF5]AKO65268.1 hypothetical protein VI33_00385 [Methylophilales bacterium MBRS-H7]AKO66587.1 hypothetical protein VI34_00385 [Methylophilales bacterium MBRSG12]